MGIGSYDVVHFLIPMEVGNIRNDVVSKHPTGQSSSAGCQTSESFWKQDDVVEGMMWFKTSNWALQLSGMPNQ